MPSISPKQARGYIDRWKLVHEREARELRSLSLETKARQLSVLMASREIFGSDPQRDDDAAKVRERWTQIRRTLGA